MQPHYSLEVTNNSNQPQDFCVFQKPGADDTVAVLAWLIAPVWSGTTVTFRWRQDYCFVWSQAGQLAPGDVFEAEQTVPADPADGLTNHITFDYRADAFLFEPGGRAQPGALSIAQSTSIPTAQAAVGVGMTNAATWAVVAQPAMNVVFEPKPTYWLAAGTFSRGEVLPPVVAGEVQLSFAGTTHLAAVLDPDGRWVIAVPHAVQA